MPPQGGFKYAMTIALPTGSVMTILFKSDWQDFPSAMVDYETTNKSFLRLVALYKSMGINNAEFPLALYQPELVGVDPFDPNLSTEQMMMISTEAQFNPWYYFRELARLPPNSGTVPRRFQANRGNIALFWCFLNHIDFGLLQPRQTGKSVSTDVLMTGINFIWATNTTINLITKDLALRNNNVERLKEIRNLLPDYIYYPNRNDADNSELLTNIARGNHYKTSVGRNDKIAADKLGRGLTVPIMHFDELAYINLIEISLPVALSSGSAARDEARENNQLYGNVYTTTAGNINSRDGGFAYRFLTGGAPWDEKYLDLPDQPSLAKVIELNSSGLKPLVYGAFNHRQLGKTDEWLLGKLRESNSSGELADRDYFNIWTSGTEGTPLTTEEKKQVKASEREIQHMEITPNGYSLRWYIPQAQVEQRMNDGHYVMGVDTSDALGEDTDATGLVIIDARTHDVVCGGRYNETNLHSLAGFFTDMMVRFPKLIFIPERKSSGMAILDYMLIQLPLHGIDPFKRIYNRIVDDPETNKTEFKEIQRPIQQRPSYFYDKYKKYFGFNTSGGGRNSRDALYGDALKSALRFGGKRVHDKTLVNELLSLTIRNGRIDHSAGNHDDMVVAYLMAHWFCTKARHLNYYGMDATRVFADAIVNPDEMSAGDRYKRAVQRQHQEQFSGLLEQLKTSQDPMIITKLEVKLRQLSSKIDVQEMMGAGIDAMIKQAQEERSRRSKIQRYSANRRGSRLGTGNTGFQRYG